MFEIVFFTLKELNGECDLKYCFTFCPHSTKLKVYQWFYWTSNPQFWEKSQPAPGPQNRLVPPFKISLGGPVRMYVSMCRYVSTTFLENRCCCNMLLLNGKKTSGSHSPMRRSTGRRHKVHHLLIGSHLHDVTSKKIFILPLFVFRAD